jgi:16S rRNA (uracil1498-N3)-methyltransferase
MKIHRFYRPEYTNIPEFKLKDNELIHQLLKVLRIKDGDQIALFNGLDNYDYITKLKIISNKEVCFTLLHTIKKIEPVKRLANLYFAIPKQGVEVVLRSSTEVGVTNFYPIITERTEKKDLNTERMTKIIIEACEQSGRNTIPFLNKVTNISNLNPLPENSVVYDTSVTQNENFTRNSPSPVNIFIGPEGGFTSEEIENFAHGGANIKKLPTYTLKTVTAAPVCLFDSMNGY